MSLSLLPYFSVRLSCRCRLKSEIGAVSINSQDERLRFPLVSVFVVISMPTSSLHFSLSLSFSVLCSFFIFIPLSLPLIFVDMVQNDRTTQRIGNLAKTGNGNLFRVERITLIFWQRSTKHSPLALAVFLIFCACIRQPSYSFTFSLILPIFEPSSFLFLLMGYSQIIHPHI